MLANVPAWCRLRAGRGPVLVVAPHGGLSEHDLLTPRAAGTLRGNDLYTAEVAEELAARLDASLLANVTVDRNELDLNRIDEVAARAPWFLAALQAELEGILARHAVARVLFVHGWHVVQPQCDVGVGARLASPYDAFAREARLTVPAAFVLGALAVLEREAARGGVRTTLGARWPAAHHNNVMQLFRRSGGTDALPAAAGLRSLAATGRVRAVQLELAAPLRWPGRWRERFLDAAAAAFAGADEGRSRRAAAGAARAAAEPVAVADGAAAFALQAHDRGAGEAGLGIVVGIGPLSRDELGARLLLLPGGQRMLLFTGHARVRPGDPLAVGGLAVTERDGCVDVRFAGPVLDVPDAGRYFAHEPAQLAARVAELELAIRVVPGPAGYGRVAGSAIADGEAWRIDAHGFTEPVLARPALAGARRATRLTASFGDSLGLTLDASSGGPPSLARITPAGRDTRSLPDRLALPCVRPDAPPDAFVVPLRDGPALACTPRCHVTVLRPVAAGVLARVTFGTATYRLGDRQGSGFYEHAAALRCGGASEDA